MISFIDEDPVLLKHLNSCANTLGMDYKSYLKCTPWEAIINGANDWRRIAEIPAECLSTNACNLMHSEAFLDCRVCLPAAYNKYLKKSVWHSLCRTEMRRSDRMDSLSPAIDFLRTMFNLSTPLNKELLKNGAVQKLGILGDLTSEEPGTRTGAIMTLADPTVTALSDVTDRQPSYSLNVSGLRIRLYVSNKDIGPISSSPILTALTILFLTGSIICVPQLNPADNEIGVGDTCTVKISVFISESFINCSNMFVQKLSDRGRDVYRQSLFTLLPVFGRTTYISQVFKVRNGSSTSGRKRYLPNNDTSRILSANENRLHNPTTHDPNSTEVPSSLVSTDSGCLDPDRACTASDDQTNSSTWTSVRECSFIETGEQVLDASVTKTGSMGLTTNELPACKYFKSKLNAYQHTGVRWLISKEKLTYSNPELIWNSYDLFDTFGGALHANCMSGVLVLGDYPSTGLIQPLGGILADEMGLGKTVQTLALIAYDKEERERQGLPRARTLIIAPLAIITQWVQEINDHCSSITVNEYHSDSRNPDSLCDITITTYGIVSSEWAARKSLFSKPWDRLILDEAHMIKNASTVTAKSVRSIDSISRWCLTGTPIQNSIEDLFSIIKLLRYEPWCIREWWNQLGNIGVSSLQKTPENIERRYSLILSPIMLRRTRNMREVCGDKEMFPPRVQFQLFIRDDDNEEYTRIKQSAIALYNSNSRHTVQTLVRILRLRQFCCSPLLYRARTQDSLTENQEPSNNPSQSTSAPAPPFAKASAETTCPICLEPPEKPALLPCRHIICLHCALEAINSDPKNTKRNRQARCAYCPLCRQLFYEHEIVNNESNPAWLDNVRSANFADLLSKKLLVAVDLIIQLSVSGSSIVIFSQWTKLLDIIAEVLTRLQLQFQRIDGSTTKNNRAESIEEFRRRSANLMVLRSDQDELFNPKQPFEATTVISKLLDPLFRSQKGKAPTIEPLEVAGYVMKSSSDICSSRLLNNVEQEGMEEVFKNIRESIKPHAIMLCSLKSAGVGLNLTMADSLIMMDTWWNPAMELQAIQRLHRIGQASRVKIFNLYIYNSIEDRLLELHRKKGTCANNILSQEGAGGEKSDSDQDIRFLLFD